LVDGDAVMPFLPRPGVFETDGKVPELASVAWVTGSGPAEDIWYMIYETLFLCIYTKKMDVHKKNGPCTQKKWLPKTPENP
jgi:hypothetical protein